MAVGVFIGYRLRHLHRIHKVTSLIQVVVCLLLFILGLSIGTNKLIISMHIPADTRSAFPVISVQSPVSIQCCWQS